MCGYSVEVSTSVESNLLHEKEFDAEGSMSINMTINFQMWEKSLGGIGGRKQKGGMRR